ncbi:MAG TPA: DNA ligase D [Flavobacterium sp.]|jgi:bifunctional non-homologous end joining protein LigD
MGLEKYNEKRDFSKTKEPKGTKKSSTGALRFVVQKHAASRLHYDFRLEIDGVLVSWAVPKGPSAHPADRRLAVQTEDHPMAYIDFEGTIPKGEYGGGTVMVWDTGTFHAEGSEDIKNDKAILKKQLQEGNIKVVLNGKKLKGSWNLIRMKTEESQWLLMKGKDEFADKNMEFDQNSVLTGKDMEAIEKSDNVWQSKETAKDKKEKKIKKKPEATEKKEQQPASFLTTEALKEALPLPEFPTHWKPQLATLADAPFDNKDWIFETKFDGYRCLAQIHKGEVTLVSRNQKPFNGKYPFIAQELQAITQDVILDGEVVVESPEGKTHFQWLQHYEDHPELGKLRFYVFDILYFQGFDLRQLPLINRKKILETLLPNNDTIIYSAHVEADGIAAFNKSRNNEGEGLIAKKADSHYHTGQRSKEWLKIKTEKQQEMVIGGFTNPQGKRKGLGALLCGYYEGKDFKYAGKVGTGFTASVLEDLREKLDPLVCKTSPFVNPPKMAGVHWVNPELIAQIKFSEFTEAQSMRHPVFLGLREDKNPTDIVIEKPSVHTGTVDESETPAPPAAAKKQKPKKKVPLKKDLEFTNTDKIFWPRQKITKGHVIAYYDTVAEYILPYLKDRPQSLRRNPDGIKNIGFFQKDVAGVVPEWIKTHKIKSESTGEQIEYLLCQDKETLLFLANWGCIELNPWSSRVGTLDKPDYIIFDVDAKDAPLTDIIATALQVKEVLDSIQVPAYIKTSGGNGLHIFIPVLPKYTYDQTRDFSHIISQMVANQLPEIVSLERTPSKRKGKVYLDFLQNGKGKTMASIYSLRPRESATISTPLDWSEVGPSLNIRRFTIKEVLKRLEEKGDLWKDFFSKSINLKEILQRI